MPARLSPGGTTFLPVSGPAANFFERSRLGLDNAPEGIVLTNASVGPAGLELVFQCDGEKAKLGTIGNLISQIAQKTSGAVDKQ